MAKYRTRTTTTRTHIGRLERSVGVRSAAGAYNRGATRLAGSVMDVRSTGNYAYQNYGRSFVSGMLSRNPEIRRNVRANFSSARVETGYVNRTMERQYLMRSIQNPRISPARSLVRSGNKEMRSARAQASRFAGQQAMIGRGHVMGIKAHAGYKVDAFRAGAAAKHEANVQKAVTFIARNPVGVRRAAAGVTLIGAAMIVRNAHAQTRTAPGKRRNVRTRRDSKGRYAGSY